MKYALLIYAVPGASENPGPAAEGVIDDWLDYTAAIKEAGVLRGAEQLTWADTATTVRLSEGSGCSPTGRSPRPRSTCSASTWWRPTASTWRSTGRPGCPSCATAP